MWLVVVPVVLEKGWVTLGDILMYQDYCGILPHALPVPASSYDAELLRKDVVQLAHGLHDMGVRGQGPKSHRTGHCNHDCLRSLLI